MASAQDVDWSRWFPPIVLSIALVGQSSGVPAWAVVFVAVVLLAASKFGALSDGHGQKTPAAAPSTSSTDGDGGRSVDTALGRVCVRGCSGVGGAARGSQDGVPAPSRPAPGASAPASAVSRSCPYFPMLHLSLVEHGQPDVGIPINSAAPVEFETEGFVGRVQFLVRPSRAQDASTAELFEGRKRRFWVQVQGRVKYANANPVFMGGEVTHKMTLGMISRNVCKIILRVASKLIKNLGSSLGVADGSVLPHIVFPMWQAVDRMVVTQPGEPLPALRCELDETAADRKKRRVGNGDKVHRFRTDCTYTFDFHCGFMDLPSWTMTGLPGLRDMELRGFWNEMPMRVVAYEAPSEGAHTLAVKKYLFCFSLCHGAPAGAAETQADTRASARRERALSEFAPPVADEGCDTDDDEEGAAAGEDDEVEEEVEEEDAGALADEVAAELGRDEAESAGVPGAAGGRATAHTAPLEAVAGAVAISPDLGSGSKVDARHWRVEVPAWLEHLNVAGGARQVLFVVRVIAKSHSWVSFVSYTQVLRAQPRELQQATRGKQRAKPPVTAKRTAASQFASIDKQRDTVTASINGMLRHLASGHRSAPSLRTLHHLLCNQEMPSPSRLELAVVPRSRHYALDRGVLCEGAVARALWGSYWREEWAVLYSGKGGRLSLYRNRATRPAVKVVTADVLGAVPMADAELERVFPGKFGFEVHTLWRVFYFVVPTEEQRNKWLEAIMRASASFLRETGSGLEDELLTVADPRQAIAADTAQRWDLPSRIVLNCRKMHFGAVGVAAAAAPGSASATAQAARLCTIVENLLEEALSLRADGSNRASFIKFFDATLQLKALDLAPINGSGAAGRAHCLCFYLNLYHLLLVHAFLVLGAPQYCVRWSQIHQNCCYEVGHTLMSLAEIEHFILRGKLSKPKGATAAKLVPSFERRGSTAGELPQDACDADPRVNLAINTGSVSGLNEIQIYKPATLNEQLHDYCTRLLDTCVMVQKKTVWLPRVLKWHMDDFGGDANACARTALKFLSRGTWQAVSLVIGCAETRVKFLKYDWQCWDHFELWQAVRTATATPPRSPPRAKFFTT